MREEEYIKELNEEELDEIDERIVELMIKNQNGGNHKMDE